MIARDYIAALRELPIVHWSALTKSLPFVVLSPHPDDESLGTGGLIALARRAGVNVQVVVLTDGSRSHPQSKSYPPERLIATRREELEQAGQLLGLSESSVHHLGFCDTKAPMAGPAFESAVRNVEKLIGSIGARSLFTTWEADPHCDHVASAQLAREILARDPSLTVWSYPIWGWHLDPASVIGPSLPRGYRIDIGPVKDRKRAAIDAHASQMTDLIADDPDGFRFQEDTLAPFAGRYEYFIEAL